MSIERCSECESSIDTDFEEGHYSIDNNFTCEDCMIKPLDELFENPLGQIDDFIRGIK